MEYRRVLLKLSGEALKGNQDYGIDVEFITSLAQDIITLHDRGMEIALVLGAGNIFRGVAGEKMGLERATGDYMGMLGTVINAMALGNVLEQQGKQVRILTSLDCPKVAEPFIRKRALKHLTQGRIIICAGGTGNPYYSTDSAAVLRALELDCDVLVKGTKVDGVYDKDPMKYGDAVKYTDLPIAQALQDGIRVMDHSAIALAKDEGLDIFVCAIEHIKSLGTQESCGTRVHA